MDSDSEDELIRDAPTIFLGTGPWNVRSLASPSNNEHPGCKIKAITSISILEEHLQHGPPAWPSTRIFVIRQQNSWGRLQISYQGFLRLLSYFRTGTSGFTDFVRAFGFKSSGIDENFGGYYRYTQQQSEQEGTDYDLCFNLRYPAHVERNGEYPWVLRHTAIYLICRISVSSSKWILLQPPQSVEKRLESMLNSPKDTETNGKLDHEYMILSMILAITERDWRPYINYLESEIEELSNVACYSSVGKTVVRDFTVAFGTSQELQLLSERLLRGLAAIDSSLESLHGIEAYLNELLKQGALSNQTLMQVELERFQSRMNGHKRALHRLLKVSAGVSNLLLRILDYRNAEVMHRSVGNIHAILESTKDENETMRIISQRTQVDSRSTRILASVSIAYLPANLVAAIFSSNMIGISGNSDGAPANTGQIGYFILTTTILTLGTACVVLLWEKYVLVGITSRIRRILHF